MGQNTQFNHRETIVSAYRYLFHCTEFYCFTQEEYLAKRKNIRSRNSYKRLTIYNQEYLRGMERMFFFNLYKDKLIYCYDFEGKRYRIDSADYKKLSPCDVSKSATWGGHCWKKDISKHYFGGNHNVV
jgi:hypothetical protein